MDPPLEWRMNLAPHRYRLVALAGTLALGAFAGVGCRADAPDTRLRSHAIERLREGLASPKVAVRCEAARTLLNLGLVGPVRESLSEMEPDPSPANRVATWSLLARTEATVESRGLWLEELRRVARDENAADRGPALVALAEIDSSSETGQLAEGLLNHQPPLVVSAAQALAILGNDLGPRRLGELLQNGDAATRRGIAALLVESPEIWDWADASVRRDILRELIASTEDATSLAALFVVGEDRERARLRSHVVTCAMSLDVELRCVACLAIARRGDKLDVEVIAPLVDDADPRVRIVAATSVLTVDKSHVRGLQPLDWLVMFAYGLVTLGIGFACARRQTNTEEYFLASRQVRPLFAGISLFAALLSTISYLAYPGEMINHGPAILWGLLGLPLAYLVVGYAIIPAIMMLPVTTAYEFLGARFGARVRMTGAMIFVATRLVWMALLVYLSANAVNQMLNLPRAALLPSIAILGIVTVIYTGVGGLRAVIITDVVQFLVMTGAVVGVLAFVTREVGGVSRWWPHAWQAHWDHYQVATLDPWVRVTVIGSILFELLWWTCTSVSDQMAIQRYLATRDAAAARRAFRVNIVAAFSLTLLLCITGFAVLAYFRDHPQLLSPNLSLTDHADALFPHFIANVLPSGMGGLVVAGLLSAAMSSLSAGINAVASVCLVDIAGSAQSVRDGESPQLRHARLATVGVGAVVICSGAVMQFVPGNIIEVSAKTNGLFVGPLAGLFLMALFYRGSSPTGVLAGAGAGALVAAVVAFWDSLTGGPPMSFQWILPAAIVAHLAVGISVSRATSSARKPFLDKTAPVKVPGG